MQSPYLNYYSAICNASFFQGCFQQFVFFVLTLQCQDFDESGHGFPSTYSYFGFSELHESVGLCLWPRWEVFNHYLFKY